MANLVVVKFNQPMSPYREGDCASFDAKMAGKIVDAGFADEIALADTKITKEK